MKKLFYFILFLPLLFPSPGNSAYWTPPSISSESMHLAGMNLLINGSPVEAGDEVGIFDSSENLIGLFVLTTDGQYGDMIITGDSVATTNIDEGAFSGEELSIRVYDASSLTEYRNDNVELIIPANGIGSYTTLDSLPLTYASNQYALLNINVTYNTPSIAVDDNYYVTEEKTLVIFAPGILGNDTDGEDDNLTKH